MTNMIGDEDRRRKKKLRRRRERSANSLVHLRLFFPAK